MNPTVDLVIGSSTGTHTIELVVGSDKNPIRIPLAPNEAAKLCADLSTTLAFSIRPTEAILRAVDEAEEEPAEEEAPEEVEEDVEVEEDELKPLTWHRKAKGTSRYETVIPESNTPVEAFLGKKGWNIKVGGKIVNKAAIARKQDAYELVESMRTEQREGISV